MRADVKAELQMLRELAWLVFGLEDGNATITIPRQCCFCGFSLLRASPPPTFGHRRHTSPPLDLTWHHQDGNRENNSRANLLPCHDSCHRSYHAQLRAATRREVIDRVTRESDAKHPEVR